MVVYTILKVACLYMLLGGDLQELGLLLQIPFKLISPTVQLHAQHNTINTSYSHVELKTP